MDDVKKLTDHLPSEPLYHYSAPGGMLGMLESKSIWMSNIRYQNDSEEYRHAFNLFEEIIKEEYTGFDLEKQLGYTKIRKELVPSVFTFSLTEEGDLLSQWRGYAPGGGYSFCLDKTLLNAFIDRFNLSIHRCVYEKDEQKDVIRGDVIKITTQEWGAVYSGAKSMDEHMIYKLKHMLSELARVAPILKHHAFSEEKEWRIIKDFDRGSPDNKSIEVHSAFDYIRTRPIGTKKMRETF